MAIHNSVLKRERQDKVRRLRNRVMKSKVHTADKQIHDIIHTHGDAEALPGLLKTYYSEVDKACKRGVFHKNKVSRLKSRMSKRIHHFIATGHEKK